ncbi:MAG: hypothetical protein ACRDOP_02250, partial [Gaiellaceae bacterium]
MQHAAMASPDPQSAPQGAVVGGIRRTVTQRLGDLEEVRDLLDLGRSRGFVTTEDVDEALDGLDLADELVAT